MRQKLRYIAILHPLYFVCSLINYLLGGILLGGTVKSFFIALVIYIISVAIALSSMGERLFRFMNGIRSLETKEEKDYLNPIAREVLNPLCQKGGPPYEEFEMCVIDSMHINACAVGRHTVAVTKGAMKAFTEEQLKGVVAHELGHLRRRDTMANLFLYIGSGYFFLWIFFIRLFINMINKIFGLNDEKTKGYYIWSFICRVLNAILFVFTLLIKITVALESRKIEYRADAIALGLGYGEEMISALYLLEKLSLGDNSNLIQKMTASHPRTTARIGRLEDYFSEEDRIQREKG